jgi:hypothetical protein
MIYKPVIGQYGSLRLSCLGSHWLEEVYSIGVQRLDYSRTFSSTIVSVRDSRYRKFWGVGGQKIFRVQAFKSGFVT